MKEVNERGLTRRSAYLVMRQARVVRLQFNYIIQPLRSVTTTSINTTLHTKNSRQ
jgi:hypothetical protein